MSGDKSDTTGDRPVGWFGSLLWRIRWWRWFLFDTPFRIGDPSLGRGATRAANRNILLDRYLEREPKR